MNDVFFYNYGFEPLEQVSGFISLNATKKYCGFGTAEIHLPITKTEIIRILVDNPYIICIARDVQMIVTGWQLGEDIAIFGRTPEWLLTKRVVAPFSLAKKTPAEIATYAVQNAMDDFADTAGDASFGETMNYSAKEPKTVYDIVCDVLNPSELGFRMTADVKQKEFIFSVYKGKEQPLMISPSNRTAYDMKYIRDMQDTADNCGWYQRELLNKGNWSASANSPSLSSGRVENYFTYYKITTAGSRFGLVCSVGSYLYCDTADGVWKVTEDKPTAKWTYIDNSETDGAMRWESILKGVKTPDEATSELNNMKAVENCETALRHVEYGKDYTEGDIVRVQTEFGDFKCTKRKRVGAVEIFYDTDTVGTRPILQSIKE